MIPSRLFVALAAAGLLLAFGAGIGALVGAPDALTTPLLAYDGLLVLVAAIDALLGRRPKLELRRAVPSVVSVGRANHVTLHVDNRDRRALNVQIADDGGAEVVPEGLPYAGRLAPGTRVSWKYALRPLRRGAHELGDLVARVKTPLGLWERQLRVPQATTIRVYPDLESVRAYEMLVRESRDERLTRATRKRGGESEFERLRDYLPDDEPRRIDWRATARRGTLIAREFQLERNQNVVFALDTGRLMTAESDGLSHLDHALNATLMLSHVAVRTGDQVGLLAFDEELRKFVPPQGGPRALQQIVRASYDLFPSLVEPDWKHAVRTLRMRLRKRSLVVLFTQVLDRSTQERLVPLVKSLSPQHLPLCVIFRDAEVDSLLERDRTGTDDLYVRGAAAAEVQWRERIVDEMRAAGALVLHVHPRELTQQLISRCLEVKARQML